MNRMGTRFLCAGMAIMLIFTGCQKKTIPFACGMPVEHQGETYPTVSIGSQCWFAANLNSGVMIQGSNDQVPANGSVEKYCHGDDPGLCSEFGGLYQWLEAMNGDPRAGSRGICPDGWHIPTDEEWAVLVEAAGPFPVSGTHLKADFGWYLDHNGDDSTGFSALPGGDRDYNGVFMNLRRSTAFWSSTANQEIYAWVRVLGFHFENTYRQYYNQKSGFSVRCLKNP